MVRGIRRVERDAGRRRQGAAAEEREPRASRAAASSPRATSRRPPVIEAGMLACRRPATGIAPRDWDRVLGRTARDAIAAGTCCSGTSSQAGG